MIFAKIGLLLFSLIGLGVFTSSLLQIISFLKCQKWPKTTGTIVNTTIKVTGGTRGGTADMSYATKSYSYLPVITYQYEIQGKKHTNNVRCFGDFGASEERAKEILSVYIQGENACVHYNPNDAKISVLETNFKIGLFLPTIIGLVMAGTGIYAFLYKFQ
ncbi:MAG: DUF3592 domain-containing protein [Maribacter sp.]|nr:DUF3592 domain-containing protein [Maribacter sp.]